MPETFDYSTPGSENVTLLNALINDETPYTEDTHSRNAEILKSIINNTEYTDAPQSEIEELLLELKEKIGGEVEIDELNVTENGTYSETGKAYSPVNVELPLSSKTITENGTYTASDDNLAGYDEVTVAVEGYAKKSISNTPTPIATFNASALPMPSLKVSIEAQQSGTGDPSPQNIRPITGWSAVNRYRTGKNLFDSNITITANYYNDNGEEITSSTTGHSALTKVNTSTLYKVFIYALNSANIGGKWGVYYWDSNMNFISRNVVDYAIDYTQNAIVFTTPNNCRYISFQLPIGTSATTGGFDKTKCFLYENDTTSPFEAFSGTIYTTALKDSQGNPLECYGGELSNENGVQSLENTDDYVEFDGSENWQIASSGYFYLSVPKANLPYKRQSDVRCKFNSLKYVGTSINNGSFLVGIDNAAGIYIGGANVSEIYIYLTDGATLSDLTTMLNTTHLQMCYELATPTTIPQDNLAISSQDGINNLWADSGDVLSGEYMEAL